VIPFTEVSMDNKADPGKVQLGSNTPLNTGSETQILLPSLQIKVTCR